MYSVDDDDPNYLLSRNLHAQKFFHVILTIKLELSEDYLEKNNLEGRVLRKSWKYPSDNIRIKHIKGI